MTTLKKTVRWLLLIEIILISFSMIIKINHIYFVYRDILNIAAIVGFIFTIILSVYYLFVSLFTKNDPV